VSQNRSPGEAFTLITKDLVGTTPWAQETLDFHTGPQTRVLWLGLRRDQSQKLNNLIQGKAWIDNLSLTKRLE
jgi:hypothetical protein